MSTPEPNFEQKAHPLNSEAPTSIISDLDQQSGKDEGQTTLIKLEASDSASQSIEEINDDLKVSTDFFGATSSSDESQPFDALQNQFLKSDEDKEMMSPPSSPPSMALGASTASSNPDAPKKSCSKLFCMIKNSKT
jgi:hypothetical protein